MRLNLTMCCAFMMLTGPASLVAPALSYAESAISLSLPIDCALGKTCFIQQYVDVDPETGSRDYRCGGATYDGHKGTDFRILSAKAAADSIGVLAAAAGRIKAVRDGMEDRFVVSLTPRPAVEGRECGNGVVIDHGQGWETQYCHLRKGSVTVAKGEEVEAGVKIGLVGYSGNAQFAHVHLSVRRNGEIVDPFLGEPINGRCLKEDAVPVSSLWQRGIASTLVYSDAAIIETGFAGAPVSPRDAEMGEIPPAEAGSEALVFFARLVNMREGDKLRLKVTGPAGFEAVNEIDPIERSKAHYVAFAGKKRRADRWPSGPYIGQVDVIRAGTVIGGAQVALDLQ